LPLRHGVLRLIAALMWSVSGHSSSMPWTGPAMGAEGFAASDLGRRRWRPALCQEPRFPRSLRPGRWRGGMSRNRSPAACVIHSGDMQRLLHPAMLAGAALIYLTSIAAAAPSSAKTGPVQQQGGPVSQKQTAPPLSLSDDQRQQIRQAIAARDTSVSFALKSAKPAQNFAPAVHAK